MSLSLVIPFYNEEENVHEVVFEIIQEFDQRKISYSLICVNNGSSDNTPNILIDLSEKYPQIKTVTVEKNKGYGFGVLKGLQLANNYYVGYSVGDGQISAADVAKVYEVAKNDNLDFCQGKRNTRDSLLRKLSTRTHNLIFHLFFPCSVYDIGSNPKIMRKNVFDEIKPMSEGWFIDGEIILKNYLRNSKMKEISVSAIIRDKGESKHIILHTIFEMLLNIIKWRFKAWFSSTRYFV